MNIDHARYFAELAKTQHIQKTARLLNINPTAISHGITRLEEELGCALTTKAGRNILLTDKGIEFARKVEVLLRQLDGLKEELAGERILPGTYTLAITHGLLNLLLTPKVLHEMIRSEDVNLEMTSLRSADVVHAVLKGTQDLGICYSPQAHPRLRAQTLRKGQLVFVARKSHPVHKARSPVARVAVLNAGIAVGTKSFQGIDNCENHSVFGRLHLKPDYPLVVDSYELMLPLLRGSDAWAFMPDLFALAHRDWLQPIDVGPAPASYTIEAVWNRDRKPLLLYRNLLNLIRKGLE